MTVPQYLRDFGHSFHSIEAYLFTGTFGGAGYGALIGRVLSCDIRYAAICGALQGVVLLCGKYALNDGILDEVEKGQESTAMKVCKVVLLHVLPLLLSALLAATVMPQATFLAGFALQLTIGAPLTLFLLALEGVRLYAQANSKN